MTSLMRYFLEGKSQCPEAPGSLLTHLLVSSTVADIPASSGCPPKQGPGPGFPQAHQRCPFLLFLVDLSVPEPWALALDDLKYEAGVIREGLSKRPYAIRGKQDRPPTGQGPATLTAGPSGPGGLALSAATGENLEELLLRLKELHDTPCGHREEPQSLRPPAAAVVAEEAAPGRPAATGDEEGAPGNWEALVQGPSCQPGTPSQHTPCLGTRPLRQRARLLPLPVSPQCFHTRLRVSDVLQWAHLC